MQAKKNQAADALSNILNLQQTGRWQDSLDAAKNFTSSHGPSAIASHLSGIACEAMGDFDAAILHFTTALGINRTPQVLTALAITRLRQKRASDAAALLEEAVSIAPAARPLAYLGKAYMETAQYPLAETALLKAAQLAPSADIFSDLGTLYIRTAKYHDARKWYAKAVEADEKNPNYWEWLAQTYLLLGEYVHAILIYLKLAKEHPGNMYCCQQLGLALRQFTPAVFDPTFREALLLCLNERRMNHFHLNTFFVALTHVDPALNAFRAMLAATDFALFKLSAVDRLHTFEDPVILLALNSFVICDIAYERVFTHARRHLLELNKENENLSAHMPFITALAAQCFLNEYLYEETETESAGKELLIQTLAGQNTWNDANEVRAALLACYCPLFQVAEKISLFDAAKIADVKNPLLRDILNEQLTDIRLERKLEADIPVLKMSTNDVSQKVRAMYEENPYPRWKNVYSTPASHNPFAPLAPLREHKVNGTLDVLVAGCGTGKHIAICHGEYPNARLLGVDLSRASLGYAKKRCLDYNIDNVELMQADILELRSLGRQFDIIECAGVLHHMADPMAGWRVLNDLLKPGGYMAIGLYSELARKDVVACREIIAERQLPGTRAGIQECRKIILSLPKNHPARSITDSGDFFSTSPCRDLLFHVQEHRFTIPQIKTCVEELNLEMIGFELSNIAYLAKYRALYPDDNKLASFENWDTFEHQYPHVFQNMYQFWCRKPV